ncbi:MAG TPA: threonine synthase, partial [bacterium]|nr:threonine synthase [bacterium]
MKYISTRGGVEPLSFQQVVLMGLADDGGLLIPESIPDARDRLQSWRKLDYLQLAQEVFSLFATDIPTDVMRSLIERSYRG